MVGGSTATLEACRSVYTHSIPLQMTQELDLSTPICDQPYLVSGEMTGAPPPVLVLQSEIFMSAHQVVREQLVKLRKTSVE